MSLSYPHARDVRALATAVLALLALALLAAVPAPARAAFTLAPPDCQVVHHNDPPENCVLTPATYYVDAGRAGYWSTPGRQDIPLVTGGDGVARGSVTVSMPHTEANCTYDDSNMVFAFTNPPCLYVASLGSIHRYEPMAAWASPGAPGITLTPVDGFDSGFPPFHQLRIDVAIPANEITADRYYMIPVDNEIGTQYGHFPGAYVFDYVVHLPKMSKGTPTASCTATPAPGATPGQYRIVSTSTDPSGTDPFAEWTFADGSTAAGSTIYHTFTEAGAQKVHLKVTGPEETAETDCPVDVPVPQLSVDISTPGQSPPFEQDQPINARVRVSASGNSPGTLSGLHFPSDLITPSSPDVTFTADPASPDPSTPFTLTSGQHKDFTITLHPTGVGRVTFSTNVVGNADVRVFTGAMGTQPVSASTDSKVAVGHALKVELTLTTDSPPAQDEDENGPVPVDVNVHVKVTNQAGETLTGVKLAELTREARVHGATVLVTRKSDPGVCGDDYSLGDLADGASAECDAVYTSDDDGEVRFSALATGVRASQSNAYGSGKADWSLKPKYRLKIWTVQDRPTPGSAIPAGDPIRLHGTVTNTSRTDAEKVGPLYPELDGAAGTESFSWDATGHDPEEFVPDDIVTLQPGEEREFTVRVSTSWSDPTMPGGAQRANSGGTRANLTFTPWAKYTDEGGVEHDVDNSEVEATRVDNTPTPLVWNVSVDDSVVIPHQTWDVYVGAFTVGGMNGVKNAAASLLRAPVDLANFSASSIHAIAVYQDQVWEEMTPEERDQFSQDVAGLAVHILKRNADKAAMTPGELYTAANTAVGMRMTELENQWQVGDSTQIVEAWSEAGTDAVSQVVMPIAAAKLARSAAAVAAIERAQAAIQAAFESTVGPHLASLARVEEVLPLLEELADGTELAPDQLEKLYGISPEELAELQKLADKYQFLLTVRSRHASSLRWLAEHSAMVKPEAIKIKSVSELDARLGYRESDIGSLVFKKPEPLIRYEAAGEGADIEAITDQYLAEQGITDPGDIAEAKKRIELRTNEWKDYEAKYKKWSGFSGDGSTGEGFLDVSYNYRGNAISDNVRKGVGKEVGFRMRPVEGDPNTLTIQFYNEKVGDWVPVTGDIDPIAFTHLDGSPLTEIEHADLVDDMANNEQLRGQHAESATFTGQDPNTHDGVKFVSKQFKIGPDGRIEPGLQVAPGQARPRVVRLNAKRSYWNGAFDYRLHWDGGFVYTGQPTVPTGLPVGANLRAAATASYVTANATAPRALPQSQDSSSPSLGRCVINYSNSSSALPLVLTDDNSIVQVGANGATTSTDWASQCLTPDPANAGATLTLDVRAGTGMVADANTGDTRIDTSQTPADGTEGTQFQPGQDIVIGAGTDHAETDTITGFGSLLLLTPLQHDHAADEAIVVVKSAPPHLPDMVNIAKPRILGAALVGHTVRATTGAWNPLPTAVTYQWLEDNRAIPGATGSSLRLTAALAGHQLRVAVTATAILHSPVASDSTSSTVKFASATTLRLRGHRALIRITTGATRRPTGTVTILAGKHRLRVKLKAARRGRLTVALPAGSYKVRASYGGAARIAPSKSPQRMVLAA